MDFHDALNDFIDAINKGIEEYSKNYGPHMYYSSDPNDKEAGFVPVGVSLGKRYAKIYTQNSGHKSVYCFVDTTNGDILMAASWKAPAKGARGNIYDTTTYNNFPPGTLGHTGWLYK